MRLYRIASSSHPIWDGTGAAIMGARWNSPGRAVIYAALAYAGAMLEVLAHTNTGKIPPSHQCVIAEVPNELAVARYEQSDLPVGWGAQDSASARALGDAWLEIGETALLIAPSVVARLEYNVLVNPAHSDTALIWILQREPVLWDTRLFPKKRTRAVSSIADGVAL